MYSFYRDPARRPMVMSSGAVACLAALEAREAERGARRARRARERRRRRLARAGLRGVGRGTTCSGRSARSAQLGDDEGDHAARSASRGQEPTPSPLSTRVEDRDEPAAQWRPGWMIETSLRRKGVRGGGSRRACGAKGVRGGGSRRACGAPVCLRQEGAAGAGGASEPSSTSIPIEGVTLLPFRSHSDHVSRLGPTADLREPSHAGRRPPHKFWRRFQMAFVRWGATTTSFGI